MLFSNAGHQGRRKRHCPHAEVGVIAFTSAQISHTSASCCDAPSVCSVQFVMGSRAGYRSWTGLWTMTGLEP